MREFKGDWRDLFNSFGVALEWKKMFLAMVGILISVIVVGSVTVFFGLLAEDAAGGTSYEAFVGDCERWLDFSWDSFRWNREGFFWLFGHGIYHIKSAGSGWFLLYLIGITVLLSLIWALFGGAITRIAAVEVACDERIETQNALSFASRKLSSYFWPFIGCCFGFAVFYFVVTLFALLGRIPVVGPWLTILLMIILPLALLSGFLMVLIALGSIFGLPLFYPAVSAEGTDAFDAISRGYSYVFSKPWHYIFYQLVATVYGVISIGFVFLFGYAMIWLTLKAGELGMGHRFFLDVLEGGGWGYPAHTGTADIIAGTIFYAWLFIVVAFIFSYSVSYFFSAQTIIYFLLRKKVDGVEMKEVFEEKEAEESVEKLAPAPAGTTGTTPVASAATTGTAPAAPPTPASGPTTPTADDKKDAGQKSDGCCSA